MNLAPIHHRDDGSAGFDYRDDAPAMIFDARGEGDGFMRAAADAAASPILAHELPAPSYAAIFQMMHADDTPEQCGIAMIILRTR